MVTIRRAADRGHLRHDGIESFHTFSFADYFEPGQMGFRSLRVLNEDRFASGSSGYAAHPHRNMEILLFVVEGSLGHEDGLKGAASVLHPGDAQGLSTGKGLTHHEFNASPERPCRVLEAWFEASRSGLEPTGSLYRLEQRNGNGNGNGKGRLELLVSPDGRNGTVSLRQDVFVYSVQLEAGHRVRHFLEPGRAAWVQMIRGDATLNRRELHKGDGASVEKLCRLEVLAQSDAELLVFDLP